MISLSIIDKPVGSVSIETDGLSHMDAGFDFRSSRHRG
jgi:hypothetical protein